jgi:hypothetical protein
VSEQTQAVEVVEAPPRRPRRRSGTIYLLSILLVLVAIAVVGDRLAAQYATEKLRTKLVAAVDNHDVRYDTIDVSIGGFPFLTQVAEGRYDDITIDMTGVRLATSSGKIVTLPMLHAVASGVNANTSDVLRGDANVVADDVTGTALVSFETLQSVVDYSRYGLQQVHFVETAGGVKATAEANVAGLDAFQVSATAGLSVVNGKIQIQLRDLSAGSVGTISLVRDYLAQLANSQVAALLPALPFGLTLNDVKVKQDGLSVSAEGHHVELTR